MATDPSFRSRELARLVLRMAVYPEYKVMSQKKHKEKYNSSPEYREIQKDYHRKWKFGLTPGEYAKKFSEQRGLCAICKGTNQDGRTLMVDHSHQSQQVRDLLCVNCNLGIGKVGENSQRMLAAVDYLNRAAWEVKDVPRMQYDQMLAGFQSPRRRLTIQDQKSRRSRSAGLKKNYGIDIDQYEWLLAKGERVCWICRKRETAKLGRNGKGKGRRVSALNVDHIHDATKRIRGLLCYNCNTGIGYFQHDIEILKTAAAYLVQWNGGSVQPNLLDKLAHGRPSLAVHGGIEARF